jgi:hypothetical protein
MQSAANVADNATAERRGDHPVPVPDEELVFHQHPQTA